MKEWEWVRVPREDADVCSCKECPKSEYLNCKLYCCDNKFKKEKEIDIYANYEIAPWCPYRKKVKNDSKKKNKKR